MVVAASSAPSTRVLPMRYSSFNSSGSRSTNGAQPQPTKIKTVAQMRLWAEERRVLALEVKLIEAELKLRRIDNIMTELNAQLAEDDCKREERRLLHLEITLLEAQIAMKKVEKNMQDLSGSINPERVERIVETVYAKPAPVPERKMETRNLSAKTAVPPTTATSTSSATTIANQAQAPASPLIRKPPAVITGKLAAILNRFENVISKNEQAQCQSASFLNNVVNDHPKTATSKATTTAPLMPLWRNQLQTNKFKQPTHFNTLGNPASTRGIPHIAAAAAAAATTPMASWRKQPQTSKFKQPTHFNTVLGGKPSNHHHNNATTTKRTPPAPASWRQLVQAKNKFQQPTHFNTMGTEKQPLVFSNKKRPLPQQGQSDNETKASNTREERPEDDAPNSHATTITATDDATDSTTGLMKRESNSGAKSPNTTESTIDESMEEEDDEYYVEEDEEELYSYHHGEANSVAEYSYMEESVRSYMEETVYSYMEETVRSGMLPQHLMDHYSVAEDYDDEEIMTVYDEETVVSYTYSLVQRSRRNRQDDDLESLKTELSSLKQELSSLRREEIKAQMDDYDHDDDLEQQQHLIMPKDLTVQAVEGRVHNYLNSSTRSTNKSTAKSNTKRPQRRGSMGKPQRRGSFGHYSSAGSSAGNYSYSTINTEDFMEEMFDDEDDDDVETILEETMHADEISEEEDDASLLLRQQELLHAEVLDADHENEGSDNLDERSYVNSVPSDKREEKSEFVDDSNFSLTIYGESELSSVGSLDPNEAVEKSEAANGGPIFEDDAPVRRIPGRMVSMLDPVRLRGYLVEADEESESQEEDLLGIPPSLTRVFPAAPCQRRHNRDEELSEEEVNENTVEFEAINDMLRAQGSMATIHSVSEEDETSSRQESIASPKLRSREKFLHPTLHVKNQMNVLNRQDDERSIDHDNEYHAPTGMHDEGSIDYGYENHVPTGSDDDEEESIDYGYDDHIPSPKVSFQGIVDYSCGVIGNSIRLENVDSRAGPRFCPVASDGVEDTLAMLVKKRQADAPKARQVSDSSSESSEEMQEEFWGSRGLLDFDPNGLSNQEDIIPLLRNPVGSAGLGKVTDERPSPMQAGTLASTRILTIEEETQMTEEEEAEAERREKFRLAHKEKGFVSVVQQAACLGRLCRLNEHTVEAMGKKDNQTKRARRASVVATNLLDIQWKSTHHGVCNELTEMGAMMRGKEVIVESVHPNPAGRSKFDKGWNDDESSTGSSHFDEFGEDIDHERENSRRSSSQVEGVVKRFKKENKEKNARMIQHLQDQQPHDVELPEASAPSTSSIIRRHQQNPTALRRCSIGTITRTLTEEAMKSATQRQARVESGALHMKGQCSCPYCHTASPFQTYAYKKEEEKREDKPPAGTWVRQNGTWGRARR